MNESVDLIARLAKREADIDTFWQYVENAYDIEPRAFFEKEARTNGFGSPLAQAAHHIWKRNPKVQELEAQLVASDAALREREALYAALEELYALVNGECPALLDEDSGGNAKLDADIARLLLLKGRLSAALREGVK